MTETATTQTAAKPAKRPRIKDEEFVDICLDAANLDDAAAKMGMKPSGVSARARRLRKIGVIVPHFKPGVRPPRKIEVEKLNARIREKLAQ